MLQLPSSGRIAPCQTSQAFSRKLRLARKELKTNTDSLRKSLTHYRFEIAALKRCIDQLKRQAKKTAKASMRFRSSDWTWAQGAQVKQSW